MKDFIIAYCLCDEPEIDMIPSRAPTKRDALVNVLRSKGWDIDDEEEIDEDSPEETILTQNGICDVSIGIHEL